MINLVIQSFGREYEYRRAILTVWSFYAYVTVRREDTQVVFFTDNPAYFEQYLYGLPVHYVLLTPEKIKQMRGEIDFLHRMKIAVIEEAFSITQGDLLYVDSDTFFISDPVVKTATLSDTQSFMHLREYSFETLRDAELPAGTTARAMYSLITSTSFRYANGHPVVVGTDQYSWNAGVMFLHRSVAGLIPDVYALTDQLYPSTRNHASEQFAFSIVLRNHMALEACDDVVYHYWYRIKKQIMDLFLARRLNYIWAALPVQDKLNEVRQWTSSFPQYLDKHVLTIRDNAIQYFNIDDFGNGIRMAIKAVLRDPFNVEFTRNIFYHIRRAIAHKK